MKVLLVDDEKEFAETLAERMKLRGTDVSVCTSSSDVIKMVEDAVYDVVVLDLKMPGMDGIEVLSALKEKFPEIQIILLTGHATLDKSMEALKLGAFDFLEKPVDIGVLSESIKDARTRKLILVEKQHTEAILKKMSSKKDGT
jgi:DNA-binding NtrC family response regulator